MSAEPGAPRDPRFSGLSEPWSRRAIAVLLGGILIFFVALELRAPYYFLQDDNRDYSLPLWVASGRAAMAGELGQINFYQSLGLPLLASGQSGALTPFSYAGVAASTLLFGHPDAAIDIATLLYFCLGGLGCLFLARTLGLSPAAGVFAGLAWCLSVFNVYVTVSWVLVAPLVGLLPWSVGLLLAILREPRVSLVGGYVLTHVLLIFTGYVPWTIYIALFEIALVAALAFFGRREPALARTLVRRLPILAGAAALTALLAAPLLLPMAHQMSLSAFRAQPLSYHDFAYAPLRPSVWLNGLLFPFARLYDFVPRGPNLFLEDGSPVAVTHVGYLSVVAVSLKHNAVFRRSPATARDRALWLGFLVLASIALVWSFGLLSPVLVHVPLLNRLRWPFRLLPFATFFALWLGAKGFDVALAGRRRTGLVAGLLAAHALNLAAANLAHDRRGFYTHLDPVPLQPPAIAEPLRGRVLAIGRPDSYMVSVLAFDYATLFRIVQFGGYETMMPKANWQATLGLNHAMPEPTAAMFFEPAEALPLKYLRAWGVRWYLVKAAAVSDYEAFLLAHGMRRVEGGAESALYVDDGAKPLVFDLDDEAASTLALDVEPNALAVRTEARTVRTVVVSFLFNSFFHATIDGVPSPLGVDRAGRMVVRVPAGRHVARIRYSDPYLRRGQLVAAIGLGICLVAFLVLRRRAAPAATPHVG